MENATLGERYRTNHINVNVNVNNEFIRRNFMQHLHCAKLYYSDYLAKNTVLSATTFASDLSRSKAPIQAYA